MAAQSPADALIAISRELDAALAGLRFGAPVTHVYRPTDYARPLHEAYLSLARPTPAALLLGMNPGPWGMAQTGVPFGEVGLVRDWLALRGEVGRPEPEHPKRPVAGLDCPRSEVSGQRLWGWARQRFGTPRSFFGCFFVHNYCPLAFLEESGRNRTPDKLPAAERTALEDPCDAALRRIVTALRPQRVIGIGRFAEKQARRALKGVEVPIATVLHPSPASPIANRGWAPQAERQLRELGIVLPGETAPA